MNAVQLKPQNEGCLYVNAKSIEKKYCKVDLSVVGALERRTAIGRQILIQKVGSASGMEFGGIKETNSFIQTP